ncbi:ABC transporter substrate-binding protein [Pseudarthrobacter sp. N5]|uniref:ABC transporter substrate-binding protein n=1 Tax=Pseudarthrobacter sp. N5 TaxID=3418416 RepID=UPI003CEEE75A
MDPGEIVRRSVLRGIILGGGAVLLSGCGQPGSSAGTQPPTVAAADPISVKDQRGKTITFSGPVTRVVTIPMPAASLLVAVDQGADHLAAMHNASWIAMRDGIMGQLHPAALKIPHDIATQDFTPNVESVRALDPDVVVQWSDSQLTAPLENAGLKVVGLNNTGTQQDVDAWIALFAAMLGKPDRATQIKARSDAELKEVQSAAIGRTQAGPRILYFNRFTGGLKVAGTNSYNDFYIKLVGGTNPASGQQGVKGSGMVGVDVEQVLAWDPEVILLGNFDGAMPNDIYSNPIWQTIAAVRARRVYKVPLGGYRWDPPGQESPLMWHWLSDISFPQPQKSQLRSKVAGYYDFLYARQPSPAQIDKILWTDVNGRSAAYGQFDAS